MSRRALLLVFGLALLVAGVMLWPLRLALPVSAGLSAANASGTIWRGRLVAAQWGGLSLGDVDVALSPASLFSFSPRVSIAGAQVSGTLASGGASGLTGRVGLVGAGTGALELEALTVRFVDGVCQDASGRVLLRQGGDTLSGVPRCAGAVAELALARPDGVVVSMLQLLPGGLGGRP